MCTYLKELSELINRKTKFEDGGNDDVVKHMVSPFYLGLLLVEIVMCYVFALFLFC